MGMEIALCHHERWNGSGYPNGLVGEAIPLSARIMAVADVYDSLRSTRPYKAGFRHEGAVKVMMRGDARTLPDYFDPDILRVFLDSSDEFSEVHRSNSDEK
jgi:putative two-component system response regulator